MKVRDLTVGSIVEQPAIPTINMPSYRFDVLKRSDIYRVGNGRRASDFIRLTIRNLTNGTTVMYSYSADAPVYIDASVDGGLLLIS